MVENPSRIEAKRTGKLTSFQVIANQQSVIFHHPRKDVHNASMIISGCGWIDTNDGVVLIDTLNNMKSARMVYNKIHEISGKIKYIIYTHGHLDHVSGCKVFMADNPEVIANKYVPDRLDKYKMLAQHINRISAQQFNLPESNMTDKMVEKIYSNLVYPTKTFSDEMTFSFGGKTFELHSARAETDDACWVWVPEIKTAIIGDLITGVFPNIGNPWKPTRFALPWIKALEEVQVKEPELLLANGAGIIYQGDDVMSVLNANIEAIRSLHDQVINYINKDMHITEMIHAVKLPDHLKDNPHLRFLYSRPEFFVYNVYRWYHGYFDHNPAHLLPRPEKEVNVELFKLINDPNKILSRAKELLDQKQAQLGLQILDVLIQADPENISARKLRIKILKKLGSQDYCLMSRNSWVYFINKDKKVLNSSVE